MVVVRAEGKLCRVCMSSSAVVLVLTRVILTSPTRHTTSASVSDTNVRTVIAQDKLRDSPKNAARGCVDHMRNKLKVGGELVESRVSDYDGRHIALTSPRTRVSSHCREIRKECYGPDTREEEEGEGGDGGRGSGDATTPWVHVALPKRAAETPGNTTFLK